MATRLAYGDHQNPDAAFQVSTEDFFDVHSVGTTLLLKLSRLVPRRTLAQEMCEAGVVKVNGLRAKSAHEVRAADLLTIRQRGRITTVRVLIVPSKPPSKRDATSLYETISVESVES